MKIETLEKKVEDLFNQVEILPENEIKSRLAEYLCIRASGLLENVVKELVLDYVSKSAPKEINTYVRSKILTLTNLEHDKIKRFLLSFSQEWHDEYSNIVTEPEAASLNSIIGLRNNFAHGGSSSTSYNTIKAHYINMKTVIERLKVIISKNRKTLRKQKVS